MSQQTDQDSAEEQREDAVVRERRPSEGQSSDIEVIDYSDDETSTASLCTSSVLSQLSNFSFLREHELQTYARQPDFISDDLSENSSMIREELRSDIELKPGVRAYVHVRNTGLNVKLNLLLALSVTAVVGLGIGNFLGWNNQLPVGQVTKLKQLQDELSLCTQNQSKTDEYILNHDTPSATQVCYNDNDYWKEKFERVSTDNRKLQKLLEKTMTICKYCLKSCNDNWKVKFEKFFEDNRKLKKLKKVIEKPMNMCKYCLKSCTV